MTTPKVIDFRVRPRIPEALKSHAAGRVSPVYAKNADQFKALDRFTPQPIDETIEEMQAAGVVHAVIAAADSETVGGVKIANETIAALVRDHPDVFTGYAGVDPRKGMEAVREFEHAVRELGLRGLNTDPFINQLYPTDPQYYPLYAKAVELGVPVFSHCSVNFDSRVVMDYGHPRHLDQVACHFPELTVIARHGGWPWVLEMIAVAWRHENVYIEISGISPKYLHRDLLTYADGLLRHKFLFGTSYPLQPFKRAVEEFLALPLRDETKQAILHDNGEKLLRATAKPPSVIDYAAWRTFKLTQRQLAPAWVKPGTNATRSQLYGAVKIRHLLYPPTSNRMVRRAKRPFADEAQRRCEESGDRVDFRDVECLDGGHRRQAQRQAARQHRLSAARRATLGAGLAASAPGENRDRPPASRLPPVRASPTPGCL